MSLNSEIRVYTKEKIKVIVSLKRGSISAYNLNSPSEERCDRRFRGGGPVGYPCKVFCRRDEKKTLNEAYANYLEMHPDLLEIEKKEAYKRVHKNLSNSVLKALEDYDLVEVGTAGKYGDYLEAMLKPIPQLDDETDEEYAKREEEVRANELMSAGISITYIIGPLVFSRFVNPYDTIKALLEIDKYKKYARIEYNNSVYGRMNKIVKLRKDTTLTKS